MKRREFITLLGGAAVWPVAARAQQQGKVARIGVARIGLLGASSESGMATRVEGFRSGLRDLGYTEGFNVIIESRWADNKYERLPELVGELVRSKVDVIVTHGTPGSLAAKRTTASIPIVVANIGDPVAGGVVASLARPGGNFTGLSFFSPQLGAKRIELLKELMPQLSSVGVLLKANNPINGPDLQAMEMTARSLKMEIQQFHVRSPSEFGNAFERMEQGRIAALVVDDDAVLIANIGAIAALSIGRRLVSSGNGDFARAGGLMGYGTDIVANYRRAAVLVDKILKGAKPADIPIEQVTKFEFVLNLKAAKALGLDVPPIMLVRADEVIE
jgi:putative tryptophan/tyrosine transport system substrate-binding protein